MANNVSFVECGMNYDVWKEANNIDNGEYQKRLAKLEPIERAKKLTYAMMYTLVEIIKVSVMSDGNKLDGFASISTSPFLNPLCLARLLVKGLICASCFAFAQLEGYKGKGLCLCLETNARVLAHFLISKKAWSTLLINAPLGYCRIESFGDVANVIQARNYIRICLTHKNIKFTAWTKNPRFWVDAFILEGGKPKNLKLVLSSKKENVVDEVPDFAKPYIDHVFTVFTYSYALEHHIKINCGVFTDDLKEISHKCKECMHCYKHGNQPFYINELKKKNGRIAKE